MKKYFTLHAKHHKETISFRFDITGDCFASRRIQKIKHFILFETSGFTTFYHYFFDVFLDAIRLLKSGKEIYLDIGVTVKIDNKDTALHLCNIRADLPKEKIYLDSHNVHAVFHYSGKLQTIDNQEVNTSFVSEWIKEVRNSQSVEKQLKIEHFCDFKKHNIANISFSPYIKNQHKTWLIKEVISAAHNIGKEVDMVNLSPFTVIFKNIRGQDTLGYWFYAYKIIELDCRCDRDVIRSAFYHEYGHLIYDYVVIDDYLSESVKRKAKQIIYTIISILNKEEALADIHEFELGEFKEYLLAPMEIFARLFASYMIYEHDVKALLEDTHFSSYEVDTVAPLIKELFTLIQTSEANHSYKCNCCQKEEGVHFYGVISHSGDFVEYGWFCMDCLYENKEKIKHLHQIKIDTISEEQLKYLAYIS